MVEELNSLRDFCDRRADYYVEKGDGERFDDFMRLKSELKEVLEEYRESEQDFDVPEQLNRIALERFDLRGGRHRDEDLNMQVSRVDVFKEIQKRLIAYTGEIGDKGLGVSETWEERYGE